MGAESQLKPAYRVELLPWRSAPFQPNPVVSPCHSAERLLCDVRKLAWMAKIAKVRPVLRRGCPTLNRNIPGVPVRATLRCYSELSFLGGLRRCTRFIVSSYVDDSRYEWSW